MRYTSRSRSTSLKYGQPPFCRCLFLGCCRPGQVLPAYVFQARSEIPVLLLHPRFDIVFGLGDARGVNGGCHAMQPSVPVPLERRPK